MDIMTAAFLCIAIITIIATGPSVGEDGVILPRMRLQ
jgi:hypothetical protein